MFFNFFEFISSELWKGAQCGPFERKIILFGQKLTFLWFLKKISSPNFDQNPAFFQTFKKIMLTKCSNSIQDNWVSFHSFFTQIPYFCRKFNQLLANFKHFLKFLFEVVRKYAFLVLIEPFFEIQPKWHLETFFPCLKLEKQFYYNHNE